MSEDDTVKDVSISIEDHQIEKEEVPVTIFNILYKEVLSTIHKDSLGVSDLIPIATKIMELVQAQPRLSGSNKKELVLSIINKIIISSGLVPPESQLMCQTITSTVLPIAIDTIVNAYQGKINLSKPSESGKTNCCEIM